MLILVHPLEDMLADLVFAYTARGLNLNEIKHEQGDSSK